MGAVGSVLACTYLSQRRGIAGLERIIAFCPAAISLGLIGFALSKVLWVSLLILVFMGGMGTLQVSCSNTVIQTLVEDSKRGRVMSFYALSLVGMIPLSKLWAGSLATHVGAPNALIVSALICCLGSLLFIQQLPQITKSIKSSFPSN